MKRISKAGPAHRLIELTVNSLTVDSTTSLSWELVDESQSLRPLTSDELARLQGFDVLTESAPCAGHAKPLNARTE